MGYLPWALFAMVTYGVTAVLLKLAFRGISPPLALVVANVAVVMTGLGWMAVVGAGRPVGLARTQPPFGWRSRPLCSRLPS